MEKTEASVTKLSSKGQIVIPKEIRKKLYLKEGDSFAILTSSGIIVLKRISAELNEFEEKSIRNLSNNADEKKEVKTSMQRHYIC